MVIVANQRQLNDIVYVHSRICEAGAVGMKRMRQERLTRKSNKR